MTNTTRQTQTIPVLKNTNGTISNTDKGTSLWKTLRATLATACIPQIPTAAASSTHRSRLDLAASTTQAASVPNPASPIATDFASIAGARVSPVTVFQTFPKCLTKYELGRIERRSEEHTSELQSPMYL